MALTDAFPPDLLLCKFSPPKPSNPINSIHELRWASSDLLTSFQHNNPLHLIIFIMSARVYQQQPGATNGMVVAPGGGGNRNAKNMPVDADGREWSHGLCGCFSACGTCKSWQALFKARTTS